MAQSSVDGDICGHVTNDRSSDGHVTSNKRLRQWRIGYMGIWAMPGEPVGWKKWAGGPVD